MAAEYVARIGERIRQRREELDLTQEDVARRLPGKVTGQRVSLWERGEHQPRADSLEALAKALDVPVSYFLAAAPNKTETPDLLGVNESERSSATQLDRIEALLKDNRALLLALAEGLNPQRPAEAPHGPPWAALDRLRAELAARDREASRPARHTRTSSTG